VLYIAFFIIGSLWGSFSNVCIYRLPNNGNVAKGRSFCPNCKNKIRWFDNIPFFSYLFLKGKCSNCSKPISIVYPLVELTTALVTLLLYMNYWLNWELIVTITLFYTLIVLSLIDLKYKAVPDYLLIVAVILTIIVGDLMNILIFAGGFALLELVLTFYIQNVKAKITKNKDLETQRALGEGDIPIAGVIGGLLGLHLGISAIFLATLLALLLSIYNLLSKKEIETPFIPFLSLGLFITFITGFNIFSWFLGYTY